MNTRKLAICLSGGLIFFLCSAALASAASLEDAVRNGDIDGVRQYIESGADVNARNARGSTPLHSAADWGYAAIAELLISNGAEVDARDEGQQTPLHVAAVEGHVEIAELLINNGADANAVDEYRNTSLHWAAGYGKENIDLAKLLLEHGADVDVRQPADGTTPLFAAVSAQNFEIVQLLIDYGADVHARSTTTEIGWQTPLTLAKYRAYKQRRRDDPIVALLVEHGAVTPEKSVSAERSRASECMSEKQVKKMNGFRSGDRLARYTGRDANVFVELVFFWEYGQPEPISDAEYDTAVVWTLARRRRVDLAPLALFNDGCAVNQDMGFISPARVSDYKKIVDLVAGKPDVDTLRAALLRLARALSEEREGVFVSTLDVTLEEVVSEFEARLKPFLGK